ncbi:PREDICTED: receptor-like serine/threonine-protein kinase ALE2 isoform X3 [Nelumbo nucifera]|uniref:Receptor-like serine/threonine-protein kinase ALE2 isoform X3 n=1 Tax=Nelumbo nucifera TaxID=4432 RepID=A0A1U8AEJ7_NELNU|nr:PREDICTED: receptor-like serine/threonine-protein kinase ALE2 isoform X3 [Nelumbo nucifera]
MLTLMVLLLPLLNLVFPCCGYPLLHINLSPSVLSSQPPSTKRILQDHDFIAVREDPYDKSVSISFFRLRPFSHLPALMPSIRGKSMPSKPAFAPSNPPQPSLGPSPAPSPYPINQGFASPTSSPISKTRHHHHHHRKRIPAVSPTPSVVSGCDQITCSEPLTSTPIGSPCGCVVPMQVELHLGVASYAVFHLIGELEIEVAEGTYLKQSQVRIMGANADNQDQGTVVDINLVPLGEKFDNTTATLTYERFLNKKVPINATLFGDYELISIKYPGIRSFLSNSMASSASVSLVSTMGPCILSVKTFTLAELEKATEKFSSKKILGEGGFGRVYHGIMEDGTEVAVKLLIRDDQNGDREFISEVEMLSRLHHRNLVKLIGICIEEHIRCLVYELVHNGSLESHLHGADKKKGVLDWDARMKIALGAARGLAYLHEDSNPRVIHRDFKASNVLLEDDFTPKVSDFGLAREATEGSNHISTRVMGTFGYVAPEYAMTGHLLVKSDVYSYGVVLLELLSGRKPVDMSQPQGQENLVTWARPLLTNQEGLEKLVDPSLAGSYNFDDMAKVAAIASMCVHPEVAQRPFMGEVVQALKLIYNDMDETCGDCCSQKEPSDTDCDLKGDFGPSDSSWWNAGGISPRLTYGCASSFITMEYCSGPLDDIDNNRPHSASSFIGGGEGSLPIRHANRSGPLRTVRSKPAFYRLRGSMSEHGGFIPRRVWGDRYWV